MDEHYVLPKGSDETALVERRILALSSSVLTPAEWLNLLSAAETVLPRKDGKRLKPSDIDLVKLGSQPHMVLFRAILKALGSENTHKANRRYQLSDWTKIVSRFADLSMYVVPPSRLDYAVELCSAAISAESMMGGIRLVNALSAVDIRVVRQLVPRQKIKEWLAVLTGRLEDECATGDEIQTYNDDEPFDPHAFSDCPNYEDWLSTSENAIDATTDFCDWSDCEQPEELSQLKRLLNTVDTPTDRSAPEEDREYVRVASPSAYWSLERMFEDL